MAELSDDIREAARVLRPSGRLAVSDVIAVDDLDEATRADIAAWTGCIAGALTESEFRAALVGAGFEDIEITPTHGVHALATAAIIRASKPRAADACCTPGALAECCEPAAKEDCCGASAGNAPPRCGCQ